MNKLLDKLLDAGSTNATMIADSVSYKDRDFIQTDIPIVNLSFSGKINNGGIVSGLTVFAGESRTYKTLLALYCLKAYLNKYDDAIAIIYDSEFSITPDYLATHRIPEDRVIHIPIENIEQFKFDVVKRLQAVSRGDKVFFMLDSLGMLPSIKELEDAANEKSVADMTRAKAIRSLVRMITPILSIKDIPFFVINHTYQTMELYSKTIVSGGQAVMLAANQIFIITRAQEKEDDELVGYRFTINIEKSRFVRSKAKFPLIVTFEEGINQWSGLLEIALDVGYITKPKKGTYVVNLPQYANKEFKESALINNSDVWDQLIMVKDFEDKVTNKYKLGSTDVREDNTTTAHSQ